MNIQNIKKMKSEKGFTIVELLIVIVVIGILAAIVIVAYNGVSNRAKATKANASASTVIKKLEAYNAEKGSYPATFSLLTTGAASTDSWYVTGITFDTTPITSTHVPSNEATVNLYSCATGSKVTYWDYNTKAPVDMYTGGASSSTTCSVAAS